MISKYISRRVLFFILLAVIIVYFFVNAFSILVGEDIYWYLTSARNIFNKGLSPFVDHYSFTFESKPIRSASVLYEIILYAFYFVFHGALGIQIFRFFCWLIPTVWLFRFMQQKHVHFIIQWFALLVLAVTFVHFPEPRPSLGSYVFAVICLKFFFEARKDLSTPNLLKLAALIFLWTNFHGSSVLGYVVVGSLYAEVFIQGLVKKNLKKTEFLRLTGLGVLTFLVGFLNHDLTHILFSARAFLYHDRWQDLIADFQPFHLVNVPLLCGFYVAISALAALYYVFKKRIAEPLIFLALGFELSKVNILFPFYVLLTLPFTVIALKELFPVTLSQRALKYSAVTVFLFFCGYFSFGPLMSIVNTDFKSIKPLLTSSYNIDDIIPYATTNHLQGNVINISEQGGMISFFFAPDLKVYADGRMNILYPFDFANQYLKVMTSTVTFKEELKKYQVQYVIAPVNMANFLLSSAIDSGKFVLEFVGTDNAILKFESGNFPKATQSFLHPSCLRDEDLPSLKIELNKAHEILSSQSELTKFLELAVSYLSARDKRSFMNTPHQGLDLTVQPSRLAAYLAEKEGVPEAALYYYNHMGRHSREDGFAMATLLCKTRSCEGAEKEVFSVPTAGRTVVDFLAFYKIMKVIQDKQGLKIMPPDKLEVLKNQLSSYLIKEERLWPKAYVCNH